jgi:hypothetical protein
VIEKAYCNQASTCNFFDAPILFVGYGERLL